MAVLVVVAHPLRSSLTQSVAHGIAAKLEASGHAVELADLAAEGFDPVFGPLDCAAFAGEAPVPANVRAEQERIDRADRLVLVYPVYWWSMPAILKGWIDRVFVSGWAFDEDPEAGIVKKLGRLNVHLVALGGADLKTYARRGYSGAMQLQIEQGIFDFCGAPVVTSELLTPDASVTPSDHLERACSVVEKITRAATPSPSS